MPQGVCQAIVEDKNQYYGKILVDDWPPYAEGWLKWRKRGLVIMPDRPWNKNYGHPQVYRYSGDVQELSRQIHQVLSAQEADTKTL